jgi:adenine-specific DNA-methyltransferase
MAFLLIVSNKFLRADYGKKLTQYLQENFTILELIDFGDLQIFEGATTYPCIITIQKRKQTDAQLVHLLKINSLDSVSDLGMMVKKEATTIEITPDDDRWVLQSQEEGEILDKIKGISQPLGRFVAGQIYYGIKTGLNDAFILTREIKEQICKKDPKSSAIIKPLLIGKDIKRFNVNYEVSAII